jgi:hypothetical protein
MDLGSAKRIRVFVKTSARDPNLLIARPLVAGQPVPLGTREAVLLLAGLDEVSAADVEAEAE